MDQKSNRVFDEMKEAVAGVIGLAYGEPPAEKEEIEKAWKDALERFNTGDFLRYRESWENLSFELYIRREGVGSDSDQVFFDILAELFHYKDLANAISIRGDVHSPEFREALLGLDKYLKEMESMYDTLDRAFVDYISDLNRIHAYPRNDEQHDYHGIACSS